jgi:hypothetical protein
MPYPPQVQHMWRESHDTLDQVDGARLVSCTAANAFAVAMLMVRGPSCLRADTAAFFDDAAASAATGGSHCQQRPDGKCARA